MTKFDELMQNYVNTDYPTLVKLAQSTVAKLLPVCKQVDQKNEGVVMLIALFLSAVGADGVLTAKEKTFVSEVLGLTEEKVDEIVNLYNGAEEELVDKLADVLTDELKFEVVNLVASIAACDETIKREEAVFIHKIIM